MVFWSSMVGLGMGIFLLGCSDVTPAPSPTPTPLLQSQMLPISAQTTINNHTIGLEVAQTPEQREIGLMNRTSLADDRGMLFLFEKPQFVAFWMKNTLIPLDIIFLLNGKVKAISVAVPPCTADPCPVYEPGTSVNQVIELGAGRAKTLGLKIGDKVKIISVIKKD